MEFTRKTSHSQTSYTINNDIISNVTDYKYLGVYFSPNLNWQRHVDYIAGWIGKALGFLHRNEKNINVPTKELFYKTDARFILHYACVFWNP